MARSASAQSNSSSSLALAVAGCQVCTPSGSELRPDVVPPPPPVDLAPQIVTAAASLGGSDEAVTCGEWQSYAAGETLEQSGSIGGLRCFDLRRWLMQHCCAGLSPPHVCQERVIGRVFSLPDARDGDSSSTTVQHQSSVAPVPEYGSAVVVGVSAEVTDLSIVNHGVDGGALEVGLSLRLTWTDGRLAWDPAEMGGCTEVLVRASDSDEPGASDIWVPGRHAGEADGGSNPATVAANGVVAWNRELQVKARCERISESGSWASRLCTFSYGSDSERLSWDEGIVEYSVADARGSQNSGGVLVKDHFAVPGYRVNEVLTLLSTQQAEGGHKAVALQIRLDPMDEKCSICGIPSATLREDIVPISHNVDGGIWNTLFQGEHEGWTCRQLNDFMSSEPMDTNNTDNSDLCTLARAYFTQPCCDGMPSQRECEANIHDLKVDSLQNTISPLDPSYNSALNMVEVSVSLDFKHILGIDVQSNTMQVLLTLDLYWIDEHLAWDPFIGGCHSMTYRASLDPEQTEIWVPEVDLLNKVEGTEGFPLSHASVSFIGGVWWTRTGVLDVACDLTGLDMFPFDVLGCYLDFGVSRDPLFHRVRYIPSPWGVEFSDRMVERVKKHQEYQVDPRRTNVTVETEVMSAYSNDFVRFQLYFDRAVPYYIWMFVLLYILFTYMSFGMFLLDQQVGERLGFGTGILFVIAAQDITMLDRTPVTPVLLWIYRFSFGSKIFVILGIVESIVVLYLYFRNDLDGDGLDDQVSGSPNEQESLISASIEQEIGENDKSDHFAENGCSEDASESGGRSNCVDDMNPSGGKQASSWKSRCNNALLFVQRKVLKYRANPSDSITKQKVKRLRLVDRTAALLCFLAYTIYWMVMVFSGVSSKGYECSNCFCGENWTDAATSGRACPNGYLDCATVDIETWGDKCYAGIPP